MIIKELLERQAENQKIAINYKDIEMSFSEWYKQSISLGWKLHEIIADSCEKIGVYLPNSIEYAITYFSILSIDKIIIPVGIQAKEKEIISTMEYCEIDLFVSTSAYQQLFEEIQSKYDKRFHIYYIDTGEVVTYNDEKEYVEKTEPVNANVCDDDKVVIMLHTSGTTSNPKRVMLTNKSLLTNIQSNVASLGLTQDDKVFIALPMFFGYSNTAQFLSHLYVGGSIYIHDEVFTARSFFKIVSEKNITNFTAVPTMLLILLRYKYTYKYDISSLRFICFGGGVMQKDSLRQLIEKYDSVEFIQTYGQTECSPRLTALKKPYTLSKLGSVGKAIPNVKIRIVDENDVDTKPYQEGEIIASGNNIMRGYFKRPEITGEVIRNGWIHTGDIGYFDEDGFIYISGRKKNMIIVGGQNVYPEEIEEIILGFEGIKDACVSGIEDDIMGEVPIAKVVIKEGVQLKELINYLKRQIPSYKMPVRFEEVDHIEKTYNGKTRR